MKQSTEQREKGTSTINNLKINAFKEGPIFLSKPGSLITTFPLRHLSELVTKYYFCFNICFITSFPFRQLRTSSSPGWLQDNIPETRTKYYVLLNSWIGAKSLKARMGTFILLNFRNISESFWTEEWQVMKETLAGLIQQSCADSKWEELSPPINFLQNEQVIWTKW